MGFLNVKGGVLTYNEYKQRVHTYKMHGLQQFKSLYNAHKNKFIPLKDLKWGEEMEYQIYQNDKNSRQIKLSARGPELISVFNQSPLALEKEIVLMPEFGSWMVEAVPTQPYNSIIDAAELLSCEEKLHDRRETLDKFFNEHDCQIASLPNVATLGTPNHIEIDDEELQKQIDLNEKDLTPINEFSQSRFVVDSTVNPHPRFSGLVKSIREHRGEKVDIRVPIYQDEKTNMTVATDDEPYPGWVYMDAMHFGMGQCCLQITYECSTMNHARYLHDQLVAFTGIMGALSASGPIQKGKLTDHDFRWEVIEQSVDCRSAEERDPTNKEKYIPKSRYSGMNHYISSHEFVKDSHNDAEPIRFDPEHKKMIQEDTEIDDRLAEHIAKMFTRDPVPAYEGEFMEDQIDDNEINSHFENIQSTNWNSLRFKPPPGQDSKIGWRVEFRTMDIQITDFENTCLIVFLGLIINVINHFNVDFIIPITKSDVNMERAHYRDAVINQKFWFNTNCISDLDDYTTNLLEESDYEKSSNKKRQEPKYEELYLHEILCGKPDTNFVGLYGLIRTFMDQQEYQAIHKEQIEQILEFLEARSKGEVPTGAKFIREYVLNHPLYKKDSIITPCLHRNIIMQIMNLYKEQATAPCDCEKDTGSNSCDSRCDQFINMFDNNFDLNEMEKFSENGDEIFDKRVFEKLSKNFSESNENGIDQYEELKSPQIDEDIDQIDSKSPAKVPISKDFQEENYLQTAIVRMKDHKAKCQKLKNKIGDHIYTKEEGRTILLGQQWFQGRTGFVNQAASSSDGGEDHIIPKVEEIVDQIKS